MYEDGDSEHLNEDELRNSISKLTYRQQTPGLKRLEKLAGIVDRWKLRKKVAEVEERRAKDEVSKSTAINGSIREVEFHREDGLRTTMKRFQQQLEEGSLSPASFLKMRRMSSDSATIPCIAEVLHHSTVLVGMRLSEISRLADYRLLYRDGAGSTVEAADKQRRHNQGVERVGRGEQNFFFEETYPVFGLIAVHGEHRNRSGCPQEDQTEPA